jgi:hypothetical protein
MCAGTVLLLPGVSVAPVSELDEVWTLSDPLALPGTLFGSGAVIDQG